ncbi:hypothetical protein H634G_02025 [Metarhizium anisopliae BRIP 53293]|uniref:Rhodopsin domain-containing protein n=1 Tax=Metarhizium anisopliae BRIP 53293 TaxID=1291518 RepID=A0A0D9P9Q5_METAN|nr:hypothetical protein H634G_02025 [Metarhizium anisopliae BRIP 53293]KJK93521.1 hypothetical protein H633G_02722 [Metarhizium anisopliae BRIP 53284]
MSSNNQEPAGGDVDRGPSALILLWVTASIAIVIVALRILGRRMRKSLGWDDWTMLFTLALYVAYAAILTRLIGIGGMRHLFYLSPEQRLQAGKWSWVSQPFVIMGFATGKISVGLLLLRVVWETAHWRKRLVIFAISSVFVITVINIIFTFAQCSPVEALWNPALIAQGKAKCWPPSVQTDFAIFLSSWNILTDVVLAVLPVTFMYNLKLSWRKKIGLCALLGLSFTAAIFATVKTKYLTSLSGRSDITCMFFFCYAPGLLDPAGARDYFLLTRKTGETYELYVWSASELFVIIVCGSVPPIKPVYDYILGKPPSSSAYANYGSGSYPHSSGISRASRNSRPSDPFKSREDELELYRPDTSSKAPSPYPSSHKIDQS